MLYRPLGPKRPAILHLRSTSCRVESARPVCHRRRLTWIFLRKLRRQGNQSHLAFRICLLQSRRGRCIPTPRQLRRSLTPEQRPRCSSLNPPPSRECSWSSPERVASIRLRRSKMLPKLIRRNRSSWQVSVDRNLATTPENDVLLEKVFFLQNIIDFTGFTGLCQKAFLLYSDGFF